jgi:4-amino-4-deoxy-L-arabinose transferase-like glycosyltransferase
MLYRMVTRPHPIAAGIICGVALGLVVLTKAVYFYFIPILGLGVLLALPFHSWRTTAISGLSAVVIAAAISGVWVYRNHQHFGSNAIAERDGNVMAIRAQFTTMTWRQYWAGYLAFTPKIGPKLIHLFGIAREDAAMFDQEDPNGFIQRYRRGEGPVSLPKGADQREMRREALIAFAENWPKQLALIPLTIYRSAFLPVGSSSGHAEHRSWPVRLIRAVFLTLATIIALAMMPAFLLNVAVSLWRLNVAKMAFHLPAIYTIGILAVMTHYIPRYNLPLLGIFALELSMACSFLGTVFFRTRSLNRFDKPNARWEQ